MKVKLAEYALKRRESGSGKSCPNIVDTGSNISVCPDTQLHSDTHDEEGRGVSSRLHRAGGWWASVDGGGKMK